MKLKKVSILTFSKENSYGANMQCYALSKILQKMSCDVSIIDAQLNKPKYSFPGNILQYINVVINTIFRSKYLPRFTKKYRNIEDLKQNPPKADLYIVGSDQVWNPAITKLLSPETYFFDFLPKTSKFISYAASFGVVESPFVENRLKIKELLDRFQDVSVREQSGVDICKNSFDINATIVLDPTLLIDDYSEIIGDRKEQNNKLFYFSLMNKPENRKIVKYMSDELGLVATIINRRSISGFKIIRFSSVSKWLKEIKNANFVVTDSFHCLTFSIIFRKNFIILPALVDRITRLENLLNMLGLSDRIYFNPNDIYTDNRWKTNVDYTGAEIVLEKEKEKSLSFLRKNLQL